MKKQILVSLFLAAVAHPLFAQSGDISGSTGQISILGKTILLVVLGLAVMAFVGVIIWGAVSLGANRPRGLAMIAGGLVGALLAGLSFALVTTLSGHAISG